MQAVEREGSIHVFPIVQFHPALFWMQETLWDGIIGVLPCMPEGYNREA